MTEPTCCGVARKLGGKKCPICLRPIRLAIVLRMLRHDARQWWYHAQLRKWGNDAEATRLERQSVRRAVEFIRTNIGREAKTHRVDCIEFLDRPSPRPFDLSIETGSHGYCVSSSNVHVGEFAAWVHCYANRIGLKYRAKTSDRV